MVFCTSVYAVYVFSKRDLWNLRSCIIFSHLKKSFHFLILISKADVFFKPKTSQKWHSKIPLKRNLHEKVIQGVNFLSSWRSPTTNFLSSGHLTTHHLLERSKVTFSAGFFFGAPFKRSRFYQAIASLGFPQVVEPGSFRFDTTLLPFVRRRRIRPMASPFSSTKSPWTFKIGWHLAHQNKTVQNHLYKTEIMIHV